MLDVEKISIDKDCLDFLQTFLFKSTADHYMACSRRAYLDFNRTLNFKGKKKSQAERQELFDKGTEILRKSITNMMDAGISSQAEYDNWHFEVCTELRNLYTKAGVAFSYGQSQKWLNMMMKYLYVLGTYSFEEIFSFLHPPLDNYIIEAAQSEFDIPRFQNAWSKVDDYQVYLNYQKALRTRISDCPPLRWEFRTWPQMAQQKS